MRLINQQLSATALMALKLAPFILLIIVYFIGPAARLSDNPNDKLLPVLSTIANSVDMMAFT